MSVSTWVFGADGWRDFLAATARTGGYLASGALPLEKDPSLFAALVRFGVPVGWALGLHLAQAAVAVALAWSVWRRGPNDLAAAATILATLIALPYLFDYDLALLAVPIAVAARAAHAQTPPGARSALVLLAVLPIALAPLGEYAFLPIGPFALWCGYLALLAIARDNPAPAAEP